MPPDERRDRRRKSPRRWREKFFAQVEGADCQSSACLMRRAHVWAGWSRFYYVGADDDSAVERFWWGSVFGDVTRSPIDPRSHYIEAPPETIGDHRIVFPANGDLRSNRHPLKDFEQHLG